jgi:hypothetical protein
MIVVISTTKYSHIEMTQMLVRLYILLARELDSCLDPHVTDEDMQAQLKSARAEALAMLSVNRVVQEKVEHECTRTLTLKAAFLEADISGTAAATKDIRTERALLKTKTLALTDLLAVFKSA